MNLAALALAAAAFAQAGGPTAAQFAAAMADACPDHRPAVRGVECARSDPGSIQFTCRYELQGADGSWAPKSAILQQAEGEWVWIDGETRCDAEDDASLN